MTKEFPTFEAWCSQEIADYRRNKSAFMSMHHVGSDKGHVHYLAAKSGDYSRKGSAARFARQAGKKEGTINTWLSAFRREEQETYDALRKAHNDEQKAEARQAARQAAKEAKASQPAAV